MQVYNFFITLLCKLSRAFTAGSAVTGDHRDDFPTWTVMPVALHRA